MSSIRTFCVSLLATTLLGGCAMQRYQPAPINAGLSASDLESRNLADPALEAYIEKTLGHSVVPWPPETWDLKSLSLAAIYFNPSLDAARAHVEEAQAAIITAGARPNPSLSLAPGVPSPYLLDLDFDVPIETAGKRAHRIQFARNLDLAAEYDLANTAWKVRSNVRAALLNYLLASRNLSLLRAEEDIRTENVTLLAQRFSVGEIPRPEVDLARISLSQIHLAISAVEGQVGQAKAALAAAIGIPASALQGFKFSWPNMDTLPTTASLSAPEIQRDAVLNRLDVRRSLAQYAAAEADLQLEIAKQYPDFHIGPGYTYEEGYSFFRLALSTTLPILNRNQGPIAEAEARRNGAGTAFLQTQAQVIADSESALALYSAALKEFTEADQSLRKLQDTQQQAMEMAVRAGEEDALTLNGVRIETSVAARARVDALGRAQKALGDLEDAVQRPLSASDEFSVSPLSPHEITMPTERKQ
jgi:cobalt-zinc-cadmium efflux system outer membrane protein